MATESAAIEWRRALVVRPATLPSCQCRTFAALRVLEFGEGIKVTRLVQPRMVTLGLWFSQRSENDAKRAEDREEKTRILANFACLRVKKMPKHRFTMDFEKTIHA